MSKQQHKSKSISDKISELLVPKPLPDPETDLDDVTLARTADYGGDEDAQEIDQRLSEIRKGNASLLDELDGKYSGKVVSRDDDDTDSDEDYEKSESSDMDDDYADVNGKQFSKQSNNSYIADEDADNDSNQQFSMRLRTFNDDDSSSKPNEIDAIEEERESGGDQSAEKNEDDDESGGENENDVESDEEEEDDDESDFDGGDIFASQTSNENKELTNVRPTSDSKELHKSMSVQNQLKIWEKFLEIRIHSQKVLISANSLPDNIKCSQFQNTSSEFSTLAAQTSDNVENLLKKLSNLQEMLIEQYPDTKTILGKRKRTSDQVDHIESSKYPKLEERLRNTFDSYKPYRNEIINKWYDRTRVLTPGNKATKASVTRNDLVRSIEDHLSNKHDLIRKSQQHKGTYPLFGGREQPQKPVVNTSETINEDQNQEMSNNTDNHLYCSEIYDDTDFYHTQLRELIEFKTNTSNNLGDMTKQFSELQKLRNKMKKDVDTRASKGRKIRYAVHNKMVNFMAQNDDSNWTNESKTELYSSLFGSGM